MKAYIKQKLFIVGNLFFRKLNGISILMYHSVGDNGSHITVTTDQFAEQMQYLKDKGYTVVSLRECIERIKKGGNVADTVVITFDDGYEDNYTNAYPILKEHAFPATIFVATNYIGESMTTSAGVDIKMMDEKQLGKLGESKIISIMPHSKTHSNLSQMNLQNLEEEIVGSRDYLTDYTKEHLDIFAPPKGKYTEEVITLLQKHGFIGNVGVQEGIVKQGDDVFRLKRNSIDAKTTMAQFKGKLSSTIDWYHKIKVWRG